MSYKYKDLQYIRDALKCYEAQLLAVSEEECSDDEFSDIQDDIMYLGSLIATVKGNIEECEGYTPKPTPVRDPE